MQRFGRTGLRVLHSSAAAPKVRALGGLSAPVTRTDDANYAGFIAAALGAGVIIGAAANNKPAQCSFGSPKVDPMTIASCMPLGHDLTLDSEHAEYMLVADALYKDFSLGQLQALSKTISGNIEDSWKYSTRFHIAVKNAISKKLLDTMPPIHCTCVFALYHEGNRMVPKGPDMPGKYHPNGENFIRRKHKQMSWLFENRKDCSWTLLGTDDGCDKDSAGQMEGIAKEMKYDNVRCLKLKEAVKAGSCPVLDNEKLKSEKWSEDDKLVKASQKGGAIIFALHEASKEGVKFPGKKHIIVYTDSDLSTDLALCGLNFKTILDGSNCSVSQRFGQEGAVNCGKLQDDGGVAPGMPRESMIHLSLRHKLRMNVLPPLSPIIDTNCGHKAITEEALQGVLKKVRDYKGSFDMDWLMCVGIDGKKKGHKKPIDVTAIPWVNSVAESNFWGGAGGATETPEQAKLKSATSWHKIFAAMVQMHNWHKADMDKDGLLTKENKEYAEWVSTMTVQQYMKLSDAILARLEGKQVVMPEPSIMKMSLAELKKLAA